MAFLAVLGPGIITSAADNDAGGITTYSVAGASYGYQLLWVIVIITAVLVIVQEMATRMGTVTQKGLGELIREEFGVRWTLFVLSVLLVANLATTIAEFAGIAAGLEIFGISRYIGVPITAIAIWFLIVRGNFRLVERAFLALALLYVTYIISGILAEPDWGHVLRGVIRPSVQADPGYMLLVIAVIGTTVTPWMQFFLQATVVDKGVDVKQYRYQKADVVIGSFLTDVVSFFIIVAAAAVLYHGHAGPVHIERAEQLAAALRPFAGGYATILFAVGLFNASLLGSAVLPLSTAYTFTEAFGFEVGINRRLREAPAFYGIYTSAILIGAGAALLPGFDPVKAMVWSQFVNGLLLPVVLYFMLRLVNNKEIMGDYTNSRWYNAVVWLTVAALISFSVVMLVASLI